jgi:nucleoid-associated protein YgaU
MAGWAGMSTGARVVAVLLVGTVLGGSGYALWMAQQKPVVPVVDAPAVEAEPVTTATTEPAAEPVAEPVAEAEPVAGPAEPEPEPEVAETEPALPEPVAPALDVVRVDPDGAALIAGKAGANARVSLRLDGIEEAVTQADSDGNFVAQFTLQANPSPRMLTVAVLLDEGGELPGGAAVAIAPIAAPARVAVADEPAAKPAAPAAIMVTEDAVSIVQEPIPADPEVAANVTVDTIAYAPDGAVLLSGRGQADAQVRLYLDNAPVMDAPLGADGKWAVTLPDTAPGIYTLRVDQVAADGTVTSRFETPFKRETREALAAAAEAEAAVEPAPEPVAEAVAEPAPEAVAEAVVEPAPEAAVEAAPEVAAAAPEPEAAPEPVAEAVVEAAPDAVATPPVSAPAPEPVAAPAEVPVPAVAETAPPAQVTITVQPGFTLWGIADSMMGDGIMYVQVFEMNRDKIRDPDLIYPGQVFIVPQE